MKYITNALNSIKVAAVTGLAALLIASPVSGHEIPCIKNKGIKGNVEVCLYLSNEGVLKQTRYESDVNGHPIRTLSDEDGDGKVDYIERQVWDNKGRRVRWEFDNNADGKVDKIERTIYDNKGNARTEYDNNADGKNVPSLEEFIREWKDAKSIPKYLD